MKNYSLKTLKISLQYLINNTEVTANGTVLEKRVLVESIDNLKIEIYHNEHPPPHFHVKCEKFNASLAVVDCTVLKGQIGGPDLKKILFWHNQNRELLIKVWNDTRPTDCPVGKIRLD